MGADVLMVERNFERFSKELQKALVVPLPPLPTKNIDRAIQGIRKIIQKPINIPFQTKDGDVIEFPGMEAVEITGPEQRVLGALAWCESISNMSPPNELVAFLSGYSHFRSTGYTNPRGYLKSKGLITYTGKGVSLTPEGRAVAIAPETPLTQSELHRAVLEKLDGPERKLLTPLLESFPQSISNTDLCARAGYMHERSTGYTNPRGRLKSFGLVEYEDGNVRAADLLFL